MILFREVIKDLFYEKTRIILTILAIAWGTFAIASMLAVGEGLRINFAKTMESAGKNLLTVNGGNTTKDYRGIPANATINLTKKDLRGIAELPNIASASPQYSFTTKLYYKNKSIDSSLYAVTPDYAPIHQIEVGRGERFISSIDLSNRDSVIVLGTKTADVFFASGSNPIGELIRVGDRPFRVIGVMQPKAQMMSAEAPDEDLNWIPVTTYELYSNPQEVDTISIVYKDVNILDKTRKQIQKIVAWNHGADPNDEGVVNFSDLAQSQLEVNKFFLGMQIFLGIIGGLTLLIAGVGIANVMFASVSRATHEIGIRMAVGATSFRIILHYIAESFVATLIGGVIGILLTALFASLMKIVPMQGQLIDAIGKPVPVLSFSVIMMVVLVLGMVGFLAGFFPALKAARIDPAEALIYE